MYLVYLLTDFTNRLTYIGMTNNFHRRIQQHNCLLCGGAKYTKRSVHWYPILIIDGFKTKREAMQCEWRLKRKGKGILNRIKYINWVINNMKQWTNKSPLIKSQELYIYINNQYKNMIKWKNTKELYWE